MTRFTYKAVTPGGTLMKGRLDKADEAAVVNHLRGEGLLPIEIAAEKSLSFAGSGQSPLSPKDLFVILDGLAGLLGGGVTLKDALAVLSRGQAGNKKRSRFLDIVNESIQGGGSLFAGVAATRMLPEESEKPLLALIRAGEEGGDLGRALRQAASLVKTRLDFQRKLQNALAYPVIVIAVAFFTVLFMGAVIAPAFEKMFADAERELPGALKVLLGINDLAPVLLLGVIGLSVVLKTKKIMAPFKKSFDGWKLHAPLIASFTVRRELAEFSYLLSSLLGGGVDLLAAFGLASGSFRNSVIEADAARARQEVENGAAVSAALEKIPYMPLDFIQLLKVGEANGTLAAMLGQAARGLQAEVESALEKAMIALPPLLIFLLGGLVAALVASVFGAILDLNQVAS